MATVPRTENRSPLEIRETIEAFLKNSRQPALMEPGEELLPLAGGNFELEVQNSRLTLQAWDRTRNLTRRVIGHKSPTAGRLELVVERFPKRQGPLFLLDLARRTGAD